MINCMPYEGQKGTMYNDKASFVRARAKSLATRYSVQARSLMGNAVLPKSGRFVGIVYRKKSVPISVHAVGWSDLPSQVE